MQPTQNIIRIPVGKIAPSPTNPRKTFDDAKLRELAESIVAIGLQQPIKVRETKKDTFEIVFGERRWRASKLAELADIDAIIDNELSEVQIAEAQLVENTLRDDVNPLEEAEGYAKLLAFPDYSMQRLVDRTGKSEAHLYGRLKLIDLAPLAKKYLREGALTASVAELIGRLRDPKLQLEATRLALCLPSDKDEDENTRDVWAIQQTLEDHGVMHESADLSGSDPANKYQFHEKPQPLSFRAFQKLYHSRFATRLETAPFDTKDAELVAGVGACTTCQHRSGHKDALTLFPDLVKPADVCTNTTCFAIKVTAAAELIKADALSRGRKILSQDELKNGKANFVDPNAEVPHDLRRPEDRDKKLTWGKLLGKKATEDVAVVAEDERGAAVEKIDKKKALEVLREEGKVAKAPKVNRDTSAASKEERAKLDAKEKEKEAKEQATREARDRAFTRTLGALAAAAEDLEPTSKKLVTFLRLVARDMVDYNSATVAARRELGGKDHAEAIGKAIDKAGFGELLGYMVELHALHARNAVIDWKDMYSMSKERREIFSDVCEVFGVSFEKHLEADHKERESAAAEPKDEKPAPKKAKPKKAKPKKGER